MDSSGPSGIRKDSINNMNKKEILEIRKLFNKEDSRLTRISGCYVDGNKEKKLQMRESYFSLPEEEMFKYNEIFKKLLSGTLGKNLTNMEFPLEEEMPEGRQAFLLKLRDSALQEDVLLDHFYEQIIGTYEYPENYLILLVHGAYDIPARTKDGADLDDASEYVYNFVLCGICPVKLSKPALCYNEMDNMIENRNRDWVVDVPEIGFLFPAFNDRNTDLHSLLYYSKNPEAPHPEINEEILGCAAPLTVKSQQSTFTGLVEEVLGEECKFETVKTIHEQLNTLLEEQKESPDPVVLDKGDVKRLLANSGVKNECLEKFDENYDEAAGERTTLVASNIANTRKFEIKLPEVTVNVNPERTDLVEIREIEGRKYLLVELTEEVEVNGIHTVN